MQRFSVEVKYPDLMRKFKGLVAMRGKTLQGVIEEFMLDYIDKYGEKLEPQEDIRPEEPIKDEDLTAMQKIMRRRNEGQND